MPLAAVYQTANSPRTSVAERMNLYFNYESRDTLKSFSFLITFKTIAKLIPEHSDHFS